MFWHTYLENKFLKFEQDISSNQQLQQIVVPFSFNPTLDDIQLRMVYSIDVIITLIILMVYLFCIPLIIFFACASTSSDDPNLEIEHESNLTAVVVKNQNLSKCAYIKLVYNILLVCNIVNKFHKNVEYLTPLIKMVF